MQYPIRKVVLTLALAALLAAEGRAQRLIGEVEFLGTVDGKNDVSGIAIDGDLAIVVSDETRVVQTLRRQGANKYEVSEPNELPLRDASDKPEMDLEGATNADGMWFVVGSHSRVRSAGDDDEDDARSRMGTVKRHKNRDCLARFRLNNDGTLKGDVESISLHKLLKKDPVLGPFTEIASKENGVDIEGIAAAGSLLFVGFRGPVLRDNYVPILVLEFDNPKQYELRFVDLDGLGVRDLTACDKGFVILAGPVGDATGPYRLIYWNGKTRLPKKGQATGELRTLGDIPSGVDGKAEGIAILKESNRDYEVLIVFDGPPKGNPTRFAFDKR